MKLLLVVFLVVAWTSGIAHGWACSASHYCANIQRWSRRAVIEDHRMLITFQKRTLAFHWPTWPSSIFSAGSMQSPSPSKGLIRMTDKAIHGPINEDCLGLGRDVLSRRSSIFLSLPIILGAAASASADVQLTYGSGSFSGSSVVNGVLSAYGLPQLPDTKGFTPFLSQYQVLSNGLFLLSSFLTSQAPIYDSPR